MNRNRKKETTMHLLAQGIFKLCLSSGFKVNWSKNSEDNDMRKKQLPFPTVADMCR